VAERTNVNKEVLRLAFPAIVNNVTVPLLGLCDTAVAGHLGSASYIGAMAVGAMMLNVIYWLCGFLRMGTSGLTAQAYGACDAAMSRDVLVKSFVIAGCLSLLSVMLQSPLLALLLRVIGPDPDVRDLAAQYFRICIWAAPAQLGMMAASGWFIGRQNTVVPMVVAVGVNVVNIVLSLALVFGFGLGFTGIAVGTLCAGWAGLCAILLMVRRELAGDSGQIKEAVTAVAVKKETVGWKKFFQINSDLFFRSACIMCVSLAMTSVGARIGETTLAANAVMMQFFLFFSYFMDGFAFAGEALVGKAAGAGNSKLLHSSVVSLVRWGVAMAALFFTVYLTGSRTITWLLTDNDAVRVLTADMTPWIVALPPVTVAAFIYDGVFIGLARTRALLTVTLVSSAIFFALAFLVPGPGYIPTNRLLWLAFETYLLLRGVLLACVYLKNHRKSLTL